MDIKKTKAAQTTVAGRRAGLVEVLLLQPKVGNLVVVDQLEFVVDPLQQFHAGEGVGLVNLVAHRGEVRPFFDEITGGVIRRGQGAWVLERTGVGGDGGEQAVGNPGCEFPAGFRDQPID